ncbi:glycosyltransferase [Bacteroides heparinolyticus]|uniref:glycosyltransferase n=1 Tax=Prevotella heparinolytica TaxID=28113 RepID=UPI0028F05447|nr:glycosyltransferase [Bacteroides heparinolyticus]
MKDFIITSLQSWDIEIGSTIKNTALEISKQNRVLYVSTPLDITSRLKGDKQSAAYRHRIKVLKGETSALRRINENMWVLDCPFTLLPVGQLPTPLFNLFNRVNNKKLGRWIVKMAGELGFKNYIHLIDTDLFRSRYLKEYIRPAISIYYRRDYVIGERYWHKHGARSEYALAASADIVLANSTNFAAELQVYNPKTYPIETGVNLSLYDASKKYETPEDIQNIPHPIIGYLGTVNSTRLDGDLLLTLAKQRPRYSFVFTGPEDAGFQAHPIHSVPNVYFLGKKTVNELPAYLRAYDVCINPQMINPMTDGNYPLKIDEYLAMGKPTVATSTHTMRDVFSAHTHLAANQEEWLSAIDAAVKEIGDKQLEQERVAFAETHSWGHSVQKIYGIIKDYQEEKK